MFAISSSPIIKCAYPSNEVLESANLLDSYLINHCDFSWRKEDTHIVSYSIFQKGTSPDWFYGCFATACRGIKLETVVPDLLWTCGL